MATPFDDVSAFFEPSEASAAVLLPAAGGSIPGYVWLDAPDDTAMADVMAADYRITYRPSEWPAVAAGDIIQVMALALEVRRQYALDDGRIARAELVLR